MLNSSCHGLIAIRALDVAGFSSETVETAIDIENVVEEFRTYLPLTCAGVVKVVVVVVVPVGGGIV